MTLGTWRQEWFGNIRGDVLGGIVVALALIPESIAFSIIAGVDPKVGLYASFCMAVVISFAGGRPAMISAATGAMSLLMVTLVKDHGLQYLFAATILTGTLQMMIGFLGLARLMRFVSKSVMTGFVNALGILILMAQLPEIFGVGWHTYPVILGGLAVIYLFPRITNAIPSPLVAIVALSIVAIVLGLDVRTVGSMGQLPDSLPVFLIPDIPLNLDTLLIILPYAAPLAVVGLLESLLTAQIIDEATETTSDKNRETTGQGIANVVTGFFGGMAGCAMIGQSGINVRSGGRGRLSTFVAGVFLLVLVVGLGDIVGRIPMPALVAVMVMVAFETFNWRSIRDLGRQPLSSSVVMLATVAVVLATHNLALGVLTGVLLSGLFFAWKIGSAFTVSTETREDGRRKTYRVSGQVFFASASDFVDAFDFNNVPDEIIIDATHAHFWDTSAVAALDKVVLRFRRADAIVRTIGLNQASATMIERLSTHHQAEPAETTAKTQAARS